MHLIKIAAVILICFGTAACSSGRGDAPVYEEMEYNVALSKTDALMAELEGLESEIPALPVRGTTTYNGTAHLDNNLAYGLADISLTADFADRSVFGRMDNFTTHENKKIHGYVDISKGKIEGQEFASDLSGVFDGNDLSGSMKGKFYGKDGGIVGGELAVMVQGQSYKGSFAAKK